MQVGPALDQLRELISILRQLSNAGPRDNSFKQWRQVTLTLLQRAWAGDQTRAVRFRRIPFSPPSAKADAKTIKESFVRGVNEAIAYLESLAQELEFAGKPRRNLVRPPEATAAPAATPPDPPRRVASPTLDRGPLEPSPFEAQRAVSDPAADGAVSGSVPPSAPSPPPAAKPAASANQEAGKAPKGPRQRLKDMLGFGDEGEAPLSEVEAVSPPFVAPPASPLPSFLAAPPKPAPAEPSAAPPPVRPPPARATQPEPPAPPARATHAEPPAPPVRVAPTPGPPSSDGDTEDLEYDLDALLADEAEPDAEPPPATLREMLDRDLMPSTVAAMRAARDVRSLAAMVDRLGVPPERRAIVRAALTDLGQQMDAPPMHWSTIRQALTFVMDYPQIARRVIPMLLPYLDEAA